jgi:pyruvate formate lyase activating enzyme
VVYAKGCNFRCRWCANPEGINELYHPAFTPAVQDLSPEEITAYAVRSKGLFGPAGGVTFGGGEATLQFEQLAQSLDLLRQARIHTALETNASNPQLASLFDRVGLLICDLKTCLPDRHREWVGADNAVVLDNLAAAARNKQDLWIRIPLVPGLNTDRAEQARMIAFLRELRAVRDSLVVELIRLHHNGEPKYRALGWEYPMDTNASVSEQDAESFRNELTAAGIDARCATQEWQHDHRS